MTNSDSDEPRAKPAEPAQRGRGLVRRLIGGRTQAPAKAAEPDGTAERAAAASAEPQAAGEDGQDSDVDAEERELHPRRPLPLEGPVDRSTENGFLASQPCRAGLIAPTSHQTLYNAQEAPEHALELDHVHGYRGYDSRHNLLYASDGRVIYPAGATCVLHDPSTHDQTHFCGHEDDVLCVALHPDGDIVASGTAGAEPAVCVWSASSGQLLAELRGFHRRGVIVLAFDATGERLVTCGLDDQHSVAVYDWRTQRLLASSPGTGRALVAGFSPLGGRLVSGGAGHFSFWSTVGAAMSPAEASYGRFSVNSNPTVTGLGWHPDGGAVTGSTTGAIYRWRTDSEACLWCCPGAHAGPVHDITFTGDVLASGGKDGRILIWAPAAMRRVDCIDLRIASAQELDAGGRAAGACVGRAPVVRSLFASADGARMLVGTATGEAWELDVRAPGSWRSGCSLLFAVHGPGTPLLDGRPPMPRACGLDAHPSELAFATVGDDATLRQWDCVQRTCTMRRQLPAPGVAVKFAPDARSLAVGLSDGRLLVLDAANGLQTKQVAHRRDPLAVLAFSPQGRWLAAGADDGAIDLYDATGNFSRVGTCTGHSDAVTHVDWSCDALYLRSNSADGELLYWEAPACEQVRFPAALKDVDWAAQTCTLGWATQGVWPAGGALEDVPACSRAASRSVLAALDDWGAVRLFRCPSDVGRADYCSALAHGPRPAAVAFTFNDEYVLSYGAGDRAVMQWRHVAPGERPRVPEELTSDVEEEALAGPHERDTHCRTCAVAPACLDGYSAGVPRFVPTAQLGLAHSGAPGPGCEPGSGAAFTPAAAALFPPDGYVREVDALAPPAEALQLSFAFGHRAADARGNVHAVGGVRGIVSHLGTACYAYERATHTMQFCVDDPAAEVGAPPRGHSDAVLCCAAHPGGTLFATGEAGRFPQVIIWSAAAPSSAPVARLPRGTLRRGVSALAFSRDGTLLAAADCTRGEARVALFRWASGTLLGCAPATTEAVVCLVWSPYQDYFVSAGLRHCAFWAIDPLRPRAAEFVPAGQAATLGGSSRARGVAQTCLCSAFPAPDAAVVGTQDGSVYLFRGYALAAAAPRAHSVTHALAARRDALVSAGKEGTVRFWALDLAACLRTLQLVHPLAFGACVKSLALVPGSTALLAATRTGELFEVDAATGSVTLLLHGHARGGVRALAVHPHVPLFASGGGDGTLRLWDAASRRPLLGRTLLPPVARAVRPGSSRLADALPVRSLSWHPDGTRIAVGTADGRLSLLTADSLDTVCVRRERGAPLTALSFSPCGSFLAAGGGDAVIDVYELDAASGAELARCGVARGHAAAVTAMDWSCDSALLQSNGADGSVCFWEMPTAVRCAAAADARNADWATHTCTAAWATQGVLPRPSGDAAPVTACDRAHSRTCVAVGDTHGVVSVYQYPAHTGAARRLFGGHAGRVAAMRFLADDTHLVSGADDGSLFLWRVCI